MITLLPKYSIIFIVISIIYLFYFMKALSNICIFTALFLFTNFFGPLFFLKNEEYKAVYFK